MGRCRFVRGFLLLALPAFFPQIARTQEIKTLSPTELARKIDEFVLKRLEKEKIQPAPTASDAEFVRRAYLDLIGRIPRVSEVRQFLADRNQNKRRDLIAKLLDHPLYVRHFTTAWRSIIIPQGNNQQTRFAIPSFDSWLTNEIRNNTRYDLLVRKILSPPVQNNNVYQNLAIYNPYGNGQSAAAYFQANEYKPENLASSATRTFLGVRLECAQCHDHPFAKYTREQFWATAAFFKDARPVARQPFIRGTVIAPQGGTAPKTVKTAPTIKIPGTNKIATAKFLVGDQPEWKAAVNPVSLFAAWVTSPNNPFFARTGANRMWAHFMGIGLIDPVDDEPTEENPNSHPELLQLLTEQFIAHNFDLKYMMRAITLSKTYQRTSRVTQKAQLNTRLFARMSTKGMTPEQVFDSIATATGFRQTGENTNPNVIGFGADNTPRGKFLARFASTEKRTERQTSILQALAMMNGKFISDATSLNRSQTLAAVCESPFMSIGDKIETLFLATLSRTPSREESARFSSYLNNGGANGDANEALTDVFWVLLNSSEFILNH